MRINSQARQSQSGWWEGANQSSGRAVRAPGSAGILAGEFKRRQVLTRAFVWSRQLASRDAGAPRGQERGQFVRANDGGGTATCGSRGRAVRAPPDDGAPSSDNSMARVRLIHSSIKTDETPELASRPLLDVIQNWVRRKWMAANANGVSSQSSGL